MIWRIYLSDYDTFETDQDPIVGTRIKAYKRVHKKARILSTSRPYSPIKLSPRLMMVETDLLILSRYQTEIVSEDGEEYTIDSWMADNNYFRGSEQDWIKDALQMKMENLTRTFSELQRAMVEAEDDGIEVEKVINGDTTRLQIVNGNERFPLTSEERDALNRRDGMPRHRGEDVLPPVAPFEDEQAPIRGNAGGEGMIAGGFEFTPRVRVPEAPPITRPTATPADGPADVTIAVPVANPWTTPAITQGTTAHEGLARDLQNRTMTRIDGLTTDAPNTREER